MPGSSILGYFFEGPNEFLAKFIGQITLPTENGGEELIIIDDYNSFFKEISAPGVHSILFALVDLKSRMK